MYRLILLLLLLCNGQLLTRAQSTPDLEATMCIGDTATMTVGVTNVDSLQWYRNGVPVHGANSDTLYAFDGGIYMLKAFLGNGNGCMDQSGDIRIYLDESKANDDHLLVPLGQVAALKILENDAANCAPFNLESLQLTQLPGMGNIINIENGIVYYKPSVTITGSDRFTYRITDVEGRTTNDAAVTLDLYVDCAIIYPNPVEHNLGITINNERIHTLKIYDLHGRVMYQTSVNSTNLQINMDAYAQGSYIVEFFENSGPGCIIKIQKR